MPDCHNEQLCAEPSPVASDGHTPAPSSRLALIQDYSVEVTCKDLPEVRAARSAIPSGARVNVTALGRESDDDRIAAISGLTDLGLRPVPHIAARRVTSTAQCSAFMARLAEVGATQEIFVIGGDRQDAAGPFNNALELIDSGLLPDYGVRRVGLAAYPEGHPSISDGLLKEDFAHKVRVLNEQGLEAYAISQFGFNARTVYDWASRATEGGGLTEIRIGVPGPTTVRKLLRYARLLGVKSSSGIVRKYGFSLTNLMATAKPGRFIDDLIDGMRSSLLVPVTLHFYTFGAIADTLAWIDDFKSQGVDDVYRT